MNKYVKKLVGSVNAHSPELLVSVGLIGMTTSTVLAVKATPKATRMLEKKKADMGVTYLTPKETVEVTWKEYVPAAVLGVLGAGCVIAGTRQSIKRGAAIATLYTVTENTLKEYQKKTAEVVGEEKAEEIRKSIVVPEPGNVNMNITDDSDYIAYTGHGNTLFYDSFSGRYFRASKNAIDAAVNSINKSLLSEHYMTMNDFYNEIGMPTIYAGSIIGWSSEVELMDVTYDSSIDNDGNAYIILTHYNRPRPINNRYSAF